MTGDKMAELVLGSVFDRAPDFVNEKGVKWWKEPDATEYAQQEDAFGTSLLDVQAWLVRLPNGEISRLLIRGSEVIWEGKTLEAVGAKIDWLKLSKRAEETNRNR